MGIRRGDWIDTNEAGDEQNWDDDADDARKRGGVWTRVRLEGWCCDEWRKYLELLHENFI